MVLSRNSARRRRFVVDPAVQLGDAEVEVVDTSSAPPRRNKKAAESDARTYSYGADRRNQRKTTDLVPKRIGSYLLVVMLLLAGLWLINFATQNAFRWASHIGQSGLDAFSMSGQGTLGSWFSSFLLIMTGLASLQIYALRQHRCDDYRGTYRLWLWMAALLVMASVHCVTNLGSIAGNLMQSISGGTLTQRAWVPLAFKLIALAVLVGRGMYEVRESRGSFALVVFVWIAYSAAAVLQLPAAESMMVGLGSETVIGNCVLFGTAALFLAHLTYARFIFLQAHGLIAIRVKKEKVSKPKKKTQPAANKQKKAKTTPAKTKRVAKTKKPATQDESVETATTAHAATTTPAAKSKRRKLRTAKPKPEAPQPQTSKSSPVAKRSPSETLKELAAASRAKEQSRSQTSTQSPASVPDDDQNNNVIKLSKSQRRKQRKLDKQQRRAA